MGSLFASLPSEEPAYRRISLRTSLFYALCSAFITGGEMVRIGQIARAGGHQDELVLEVISLVLWLGLGMHWGRGVWECTKQSANREKKGGTA